MVTIHIKPSHHARLFRFLLLVYIGENVRYNTINMSNKLIKWLIIKLIGKRTVIANATITEFTESINDNALTINCLVVDDSIMESMTR